MIISANTQEDANNKDSFQYMGQGSLQNLDAQLNQWQRQTKVYDEDNQIEEERKTTEGQIVQTD